MLLALTSATRRSRRSVAGTDLVAQWRFTTVHERTPDEWPCCSSPTWRTPARPACRTGLGHRLGGATVATDLAAGIHQACASPRWRSVPRAAADHAGRGRAAHGGADRVVNTLAAHPCSPGHDRRGLRHRDHVRLHHGRWALHWRRDRAGVRTAADNLIRRTAQASRHEPGGAPTVIGRRTEACIRSGVSSVPPRPWAGSCAESSPSGPGRVPLVVATGGSRRSSRRWCRKSSAWSPLTLIGLRIAAGHLG